MSLDEAFAALGFNPTAPGNTFIAIVTDIHIDPISRVYNTPTIDDRLVNVIMTMNPPPSRIVFLGDLAISCTEAFGVTLTPEAVQWSLDELVKGKQELTRFAPIPVSIMLGNHDTHNYDTDGSIWRQVFTTEPTYQALQIGGMWWFLLNGNHSGYIEPAQEAWLAQQVAALDPATELAIGVHQPSLYSVGAERGIGQTLARVFANHTGKIWMFSGHSHRFSLHRYLLPKTAITVVGVTTANAEAFNDGRNPGFMVAGFSGGRLAALVRRDCKQPGYEYLDPESAPTIPLPKSWSPVPFPIRLFEEGSYDRTGILVEAIANDAKTWWAYTGSLTFRVPMHPRADQLLLLAGVYPQLPILELSVDNGATWFPPVDIVTSPNDQLFTIPLPQSVRNCAAPLFRMTVIGNRIGVGWTVSGFGLAANPDNVTPLEEWRFEHFATVLDEGEASAEANPAGDGLNNLAKFAFGLNPKKHDRRVVDPAAPTLGGEPLLTVQKNGSDVLGLQATFLRRTASSSPGVQYWIEGSTDLQHWQKIVGNTEIVTPVQADWELVNTWIPRSASWGQFYWRVSVHPI